MASGLLFVWIFTFFALAFGKSILAKVTSVTVIGPVLLLAVLVGQTATLPGASDGIAFYLGRFEWDQLAM